jgi:lipopolysaccharide/colanic/teichoic acid biosynthesis glycosyltransferase
MAIAALAALSPLFILIMLLCMVFHGNPVFFKQTRIGLHGKDFQLLKFRTMSISDVPRGSNFDIGDSSRVTRFGRILRRTKLDELPQLLNVLIGDMSFVGPRPEVREWTLVYPEKWEIVHLHKPGITDTASIHFRNEESMLNKSDSPKETYRLEILPAKLDMNINYVQNQSMIGDMIIIIKTIITVITKL